MRRVWCCCRCWRSCCSRRRAGRGTWFSWIRSPRRRRRPTMPASSRIAFELAGSMLGRDVALRGQGAFDYDASRGRLELDASSLVTGAVEVRAVDSTLYVRVPAGLSVPSVKPWVAVRDGRSLDVFNSASCSRILVSCSPSRARPALVSRNGLGSRSRYEDDALHGAARANEGARGERPGARPDRGGASAARRLAEELRRRVAAQTAYHRLRRR